MKRGFFAYGFRVMIGFLFCSLLMSVAVMALWNWLIPEIFNGPQIHYLQALGILILFRLLAGGFGWKGCSGGCQTHGTHGYWRKHWEAKLSKMTPEEREKAKEKYKKWCGLPDNDAEKQQD